MKDSNDLHRLIRSLTKSEKRYFKLYCSTEKGVKNYLLLFDEIEKQEEYDEDKLKKKFLGKSFLKQFSVLKHELYNKILTVLAMIDSDKSLYSKVRWLLNEVEVLRRKKLCAQALKRLNKAKAICQEHDLNDLLVEVFWLERALISDLLMVMNEDELKEWYDNVYQVMEDVKSSFDYNYWIDYLNMNVLYPSKADQSHVEEQFTRILGDPIFQDENLAKTPLTRSIFHYMHMTHAFYANDWEKCYTHSTSRLKLFESLPSFSAPRPNGHASAIVNHFLSCKKTRRWEEATSCIDKLRKLPAAPTDPVVRSYIFGCQLSLYSFALPSQLPPVLIALENEADELFMRLDKYNATVLQYSKAYAHFVIGDHRNALRTIAQVKGNSLSFKEDLQLYIRLLELMIHYEKENDDLMQPLVNSFYRFIKRRGSLTPFENELLHFFTNLYKKKETFNMRAFYQRLQEIAAADSKNMRVLEYIDILTWVKSKAAKQSMAEIIEDDPMRLAS